MPTLRPAAVAGRFYPDDPVEMRATVRRLLDDAGAPSTDIAIKAIIVPHAGFPFSGPVAATAYRALERSKHDFSRVVLIGPAHYAATESIVVCNADEFETPLGRVPVDSETVRQLRLQPGIEVSDVAHHPEHCLEVQLPFLQMVLGEFQIVPLLAGRCPAEDVRSVLSRFWNDGETLIVISSDLSHYHDYPTARELDRATADAIAAGNGDHLRGDRACGFLGIAAAISLAKDGGVKPQLLDLRNSGDTAGPRDRVVGYGSFLIPDSPCWSPLTTSPEMP